MQRSVRYASATPTTLTILVLRVNTHSLAQQEQRHVLEVAWLSHGAENVKEVTSAVAQLRE